MEEPYGGGVPSWLLFKIISQDHKVVFTGTGFGEFLVAMVNGEDYFYWA